MTPPRERCQARTRKGDRCRNPAGPDGLCALHRRQLEEVAAADSAKPGTRRGAPEPHRVVPGPQSPGTPEPHRVVPGPPGREGSPTEDEDVRLSTAPPRDRRRLVHGC